MGTTTGGIPYPDSTAAPNVPADLQALAEGVEDEFYTGGAYVTATTGFTAASNFTLTAVRYRIIGPFVELYVVVARTTSAVTVAAGNGDITNVDILSAIPAAIIPANTKYGHTGGTGRAAVYAMSSAGVVAIAAVAGDGTNILNGDSLSAAFLYMLG